MLGAQGAIKKGPNIVIEKINVAERQRQDVPATRPPGTPEQRKKVKPTVPPMHDFSKSQSVKHLPKYMEVQENVGNRSRKYLLKPKQRKPYLLVKTTKKKEEELFHHPLQNILHTKEPN